MSDNPEALRLAEHLERFRSFPDDQAAAAELRRLRAGNACKAEFLTTAIERIHNESKLKNVVATPLFAWRETA